MEISTLPLPPDRCDPAGRDALALTVCGASVPGRRAYNTVLVQNFFERPTEYTTTSLLTALRATRGFWGHFRYPNKDRIALSEPPPVDVNRSRRSPCR